MFEIDILKHRPVLHVQNLEILHRPIDQVESSVVDLFVARYQTPIHVIDLRRTVSAAAMAGRQPLFLRLSIQIASLTRQAIIYRMNRRRRRVRMVCHVARYTPTATG